ncbi:hypothetical protein BZL30_6909 [Mycobacterium kansasii]|uniref:Uncharacterized protein n=1 Tax=Mycobacterium kansasii TaxID=1768 RepID=A0A1V3WTT3_MYCKA|nr:hypothetical protein BZL30_6909 [Mycobacterium kansasii]OOK69946.1 hypothetical protein BZL29_6076 [Mycobacterium kansasii]
MHRASQHRPSPPARSTFGADRARNRLIRRSHPPRRIVVAGLTDYFVIAMRCAWFPA